MYDAATGRMCFAEALPYLKRSQPVARATWAGAYVLRDPTSRSGITFHSAVSHFPWAPSSDDVLAEDWIAVIPTADTQQGTPK
jgi:hypothetical protein